MKTTSRITTAFAVLAATASFPQISHAATVHFTDGTFGPGTWSTTKLIDTTGSGATFNAVQQVSGGNPLNYRETTHVFGVGGDPSGFGAIALAHLSGAFYSPAFQGEISSIDYSFSLRDTTSAVVAYSLLIYQSGTFYRSAYTITTDNWATSSHSGLTAASFFEVDASQPYAAAYLDVSSHPDFSASGGALQLGYYTANSTNLGSVTSISGIDNFDVSIHSVPEPSATLLGTASSVLLLLRRRRLSRSV